MPLPSFETLLFEQVGHVAIITLNRPERLNAFGAGMIPELEKAWQYIGDDDDIWVSIITGAGRRAFCAGADVKEAVADIRGEHSSDGRRVRMESGMFQGRYKGSPLTAKYNNVFKPVIAAINGMVTGGGLHLFADADIVICSDNAEFFDSHVSSGHVSGLDVILLSRRIPYSAALRMSLMGNQERLSAQRAYELGLTTEVVPFDRLRERSLEIADAICHNAPIAVRKTVEAAWRGQDMPIWNALLMGDFLIHTNRMSDDFVEGNTAFVEKRPPVWRNR